LPIKPRASLNSILYADTAVPVPSIL
jgi:hypothetical protein